MFNKRGLTLTEILIVLVILGIISGFGIPAFTGTLEQSRMNEARVNLGIIQMAQRVFRANNNTYWNGGAAAIDITANNPNNAINTGLNIDIIGRYYPTMTVQGLANTYTATSGRAGGAAVNWSFTMTQAGVLNCTGTGCPCNPCQ